MDSTYAMAYTEVLEILKYIPREEYDKIPKEKIEFYQRNKDNNYFYTFDVSKPINEQKISRKANSIIVSLYMQYFATPIEKENLELILKQNEEKYQKELREKYNPDNLFKNDTLKNNQEQIKEHNEEKMLVPVEKISIFRKIINKFIKLFK